MDTTRKILIYVAFIAVGIVATVLRMWFLGGQRNSFRHEIINYTFILIIFAAIAAVIIYMNN